ncbi:MAG: FAD-dependent oxidoreductase, partial [Methanobacteriota archaeon]
GDSIMIDKVKSSDKVEIHVNTKTLEVFGETFVSGIKVEESGSEKTLYVQGVFIEIGWAPNPPKIKVEGGEISLNKGGAIKINEHCETSIPGLYAAGDVSSVPERQIIVAAGQGCIASLSVFKYLSTKKFN